jgi:hypothetical protein
LVNHPGVTGTLFTIDAVQVFIAAEDHPPPHVHAWHQGERWRARFRFSYLSDVAGLYGVRTMNRRPRAPTLTTIQDAVIDNLVLCRAAWWETHGATGGLGLVNRRLEMRDGPRGVQVRVALRPLATAIAIRSAGYDPPSQLVRLVLADERRLSLMAGEHIEEAEEWS